MFNELMLASQSVQALGTLLKAANGLANYNEIVAKVSEVNEKLMGANAVALAAQEKQSALSGLRSGGNSASSATGAKPISYSATMSNRPFHRADVEQRASPTVGCRSCQTIARGGRSCGRCQGWILLSAA